MNLAWNLSEATRIGYVTSSLTTRYGFHKSISSISLDHDKAAVAETVNSKKLGWEQGIVGDTQKHSSARSLGVSSVPLYILLDPSGRILHRTYRFEEAAKSLKTKLDESID